MKGVGGSDPVALFVEHGADGHITAQGALRQMSLSRVHDYNARPRIVNQLADHLPPRTEHRRPILGILCFVSRLFHIR